MRNTFDQAFSNNLFSRTIDEIINEGFFSSLDSNFWEFPEKYILEVAVPGFSKRNIEVIIDNDSMIVKAKNTKKIRTGFFRKRIEVDLKTRTRSFYLPSDVNLKKIRYSCKNGMLEIRLPKTNYPA